MSWVTELLDKYNKQSEPFRPKRFEVNRQPLDVTSYYDDLGTFRNISRLGTERENIRSRNRAALAQAQAQHQPMITGNPPPIQTGKLGQPLGQTRVTSGYGHRNHPIQRVRKMHTGIDLAAPEGTPIYATHSGVVQTAGMQGGYGNLVVLGGGNGLQTYYAHQSRLNVKAGDRVQQGQIIGYVGSTGMSTGPHLHYEVRLNGKHVNPAGYM